MAAALPLPKERPVVSPSGFTRRYGNTIQARIGVVRRLLLALDAETVNTVGSMRQNQHACRWCAPAIDAPATRLRDHAVGRNAGIS